MARRRRGPSEGYKVKAPAQERGSDRASRRPETPRAERVEAEPAAGARRAPTAGPVSAGVAQRLQAAAGNRAVAGLLAQRRTPARPRVQRLVAGPDGAGAAKRAGPDSDPKFAALKAEVKGKQQQLAAHPPAKAEAEAAQGAAVPPQDDKEAQGKTANAEKMNAAKPGEFDKAAFVTRRQRGDRQAGPEEPRRGRQVRRLRQGRRRSRAEVTRPGRRRQGGVGRADRDGDHGSAGHSKAARPSRSRRSPPDRPPRAPGRAGPGAARCRTRRRREATDFSAGPAQVDRQMADAEVTEEQLAKSNEPELHRRAGSEEGRRGSTRRPPPVPVRAARGARRWPARRRARRRRRGRDDARWRPTAGTAGAAGRRRARPRPRAPTRRSAPQVTATLQKVFDATKKDVEDILDRPGQEGRRRSSPPGRRPPGTPSPPSTSGGWTSTRTGATRA